MNRICVLSDIHGNVVALEAVLRDIRQKGCDLLVVAGDLAAHGPSPVESVDLVRELDAVVLRGNTDRYLGQAGAVASGNRSPEQIASLNWTREQLGDERLSYLYGLPPQANFDGLLVVHGSPGDDEHGIWPWTPEEEILADPWQGLLACGHTHHPVQRMVACGELVNVGSVGWPLDGDPRSSYAVLEFAGSGGRHSWQVTLRRVDYDRDRALAELDRRQVPWRQTVRHYIETAQWRSPLAAGRRAPK